MGPFLIWEKIQRETVDFFSIFNTEKQIAYNKGLDQKHSLQIKEIANLDKLMDDALNLLNVQVNTQVNGTQEKCESIDEHYLFLMNRATNILAKEEKELLKNEKYFVQLLRVTANLARTNYLSPTYAERDSSSIELMINVRLKALNEVLDSSKVSTQESMFVNNALGETYNHLFEITGAKENLEKTIKHLSKAVSLSQEINDDYHSSLISSHTKAAYLSLYKITNDSNLLDEALNFSTKMIHASISRPQIEQYYSFTNFAITANYILKKKFKYDELNSKEKSMNLKNSNDINYDGDDLKLVKESLIAMSKSINIYENLSVEEKKQIKPDSICISYADAYYSASLLEEMTKDHSKYFYFQIDCLEKLVKLGNENKHLFNGELSNGMRNAVEHYANYASKRLSAFKNI